MNTSTKQKKQKQTHRHREQTCGCQGRGEEGWIGSLRLADKNYYKMDKQQGPTVYSVFHNRPQWKRI